MKAMLAVFKREVRSYFSSPLAYVLGGIFVAINGLIFFNLLVEYVNNIQNLPENMRAGITFVDAVVLKFFGNLNFLLFIVTPLFTMRLLAEEKKQQTISLLFTSPLTDWQIILAKYLSAMTMVGGLVFLTLIFPTILSLAGMSDAPTLLSGYLAIMLNCFVFVALGLMASGWTENQIVAAIVGVVLILSTWIFGWVGQVTSNYYLAETFRYIGMASHFENIARGILSTSDLCYYAISIFFVLFIGKKTLSARSWS